MKKFAFFDFDKTITCEHSFFSLTKFAVKRHPLKSFPHLLQALFCFILALFTKDYRRPKNAILRCYYLLTEEEKNRFLHEVMPKKYYKDALREIQKRKDQGYTLFLASASMEPYLIPLGKNLGFDYVLGTRVAEGKIVGLNHHHREKVTRLETLFKEENIVFVKDDSVAYSDSYSSDQPMLDLAQHKYLINSSVHKEGFVNLTWS